MAAINVGSTNSELLKRVAALWDILALTRSSYEPRTYERVFQKAITNTVSLRARQGVE